MAGPTTDYGYTSFGSNVSTPGYVTESAAGATCSASGSCTYTFVHAVPAKATGTYAIGVEARRTETVLTGTPAQQSIQYGAPNKVVYFSVDGSPIVDRRSVVQLSNCNQCHVSLQLHGTLRNNTEYCVMCHNPSNTDASARGSATNPVDKAAPPQGINFNLLVHRIHYGINMQASQRTYVVVGFGGSHNDFSSTLFPALEPDRRSHGHRELLVVPHQRERTESSVRTESGGRSARTGQSERPDFLGLFGMPRGYSGGVSHAFEHLVARRSVPGLSQLGRRVCGRPSPCAILIRVGG